MSRDELAQRINYSTSLIAMIESKKRIPRLDFAQRCERSPAGQPRRQRTAPLGPARV
jgi:transcriptional regulator with XRE-family HTH domain